MYLKQQRQCPCTRRRTASGARLEKLSGTLQQYSGTRSCQPTIACMCHDASSRRTEHSRAAVDCLLSWQAVLLFLSYPSVLCAHC